MAQTALVMMADDDYPEGRGRMTTLLTTANELGGDATVYFHGAGVNWLKTFAANEHPFAKAYGERFEAVKPRDRRSVQLLRKRAVRRRRSSRQPRHSDPRR